MNEPTVQENESFRDHINTINDQGKRNWIYPKKPSGRYYTARTIVSWILLAVLFGTPFIKIHNEPFLLLNIFERKFILFSLSFGPYDFNILVLVMIASVIFVVLFTAIYGRVFCGWICPQTVFLEMVFRKIEYFIEGDANSQRALNAAPMSGSKFVKKFGKTSIFFILSFLIAHIFMAYIISVDGVLKVVTSPPSENPSGFIAIMVFTGLFFFVFSWFREQACIIVCPYGRLQGVLLDQNSLVVAYDYKRGEPRAKFNKSKERLEGDCIDCHQCVDVCPTGIDIRDGIQLECINCTACIDACDNIMDKINKPRGLVRYASQKGIAENTKFKITPRIAVYSVILTILLTIITILIATRKDVQVDLVRTPGMMYQDQPDNKISNLYNFHIINKTFEEIPINFKLKNAEGIIQILGDETTVKPQGVFQGRMMIVFPKDFIKLRHKDIEIGVFQNGKEISVLKTTFWAKSHEKK